MPAGTPTIAEKIQHHWGALLFYALPLAAMVIFPLAAGFDHTITNLLLYIIIYCVFALGLNVVVGFTGLLDLGFVSFMAVGAVFTSLCLVMTVDAETGRLVFPVGGTEAVAGDHPLIFPFSIFLIIAASGLICAVIGLLRGIPTLRLSGDYYAIVTLGIAEIIFLVLFNEEWLTGGAFGIKLKTASMPELLGELLYWDTPQFYFLVFFILLVTIAAMYRCQYSRMGRAWAAIRLDETAARACGVNVAKYKMIAFAVSGFIGGVGGALYALWQGNVAVRNLEVWQSILVLCCIVLGGMGSIRGVLLGTAILIFINEIPRLELFSLDIPNEARYLVYGILIILLMRFRPQGLLPLKPRKVKVDEQDLADLRRKESPLFGLEHPEQGAP